MESTDSSSGSQQQPQLPPGFRFHPTDEELVVHYLKKKAAAAPLPVAIIADIDLYKFDPWELPAKAVFGEQEWYFFSPRDRKYPNGARPNRAATSGYWKATGTDKAVLTAGGTTKVGVKKALVFYGGKPPKGIKTNWIMHEYRLADNKPITSKPDFANKKACSLRLDDWVLCRIYKKHNSQRPVDHHHQQQDHDHDHMINNGLSAVGQQQQQQHRININMGNDQSGLYELGLMNDDGMMNTCQLGSNKASGSTQVHNLLPPTKRMLPGLYWDHERDSSSNTKRFLSENFDGIRSSDHDQNSNSIATILGQLPQNPSSMQQQLGSLGDGVFGQQAFQVPGINWYT